MFFPSSRPLIVVAAALALILPARSQEVQSRPGLALVKPQAWSKPDESTVMEFLAFTDRSVKGTPGAGYFELKTKTADKRQVAASKVVKFVVYPDLSLYPEIVKPEDRAEIALIADELQGVMRQYPVTRPYLDPYLKQVNAELAQFDSGKIKRGGQWQEKETFVAGQITTLGAQLKAAILKASPASSFDLSNDPHFVALQEMSGRSASAKTLVSELTGLHDQRLRAESRDDLIGRLQDNKLGLSEAEGAVARLRTLKPEEDAKSTAFLKKWDADSAVVKKASETAKPLAEKIEAQFAALEKVEAPPELDPEIAREVAPLDEEMKLFMAGNPTPVLLLEARQPVAIYRVSDGLKKLKPAFEQKQLLEAKDILDPIVGKADAIGPNTVKALTALQGEITTKIEAFSRKREDAKLLLNTGKQKEALASYEAALAIIPDPAIAEQINQLKQSLPPAQK